MPVITITERKRMLCDIIRMALIDRVLKPEEHAFIHAVGSRMGIEKYDIQNLIIHYDTLAPFIPVNAQERIVHFYRIMSIMFIDDEVHESELLLLYKLALKFGYRKETIDDLIKVMQQKPFGQISAEELLGIHNRNCN